MFPLKELNSFLRVFCFFVEVFCIGFALFAVLTSLQGSGNFGPPKIAKRPTAHAIFTAPLHPPAPLASPISQKVVKYQQKKQNITKNEFIIQRKYRYPYNKALFVTSLSFNAIFET